MSDSPLSIKADRVLFGRDNTLKSLEERVMAKEKLRLLLTGPSGIGKSELLRELDGSLRLIHGEVCLRYEIRSGAHSVQDMLSNLAVQLLNQADVEHREGFAEALTNISTEDTWSLGTAALLDAVSIIAPHLKTVTESLLTSLRSRSSGATAQNIARAGRDDLLAGFIRLIEALDAAGVRGSILIDRLEGGAQAVQEASLALAVSLPSRWATVFAINDETLDGLKSLERVRPEITYIGGETLRLDPLDVGALESWTKAVRGNAGDINELSNVLENCGGRPLFLRDWVNGLMSAEASKLILGNRLGNYYEQRINSLSADARWLLIRLAILPENSIFSFEFCHHLREIQSSGTSTDSTWEVLRTLKDENFVEPLNEGFRIVHAVTRNHVFNTLPEALLKAAALDLVHVISGVSLQPSEPEDRYVRLVLSSLAEDQEAVTRLTLPTASQLFFAGSYRPALNAYKIGLDAGQSSGNLELSIESLIGISAVLLNTGYYQEALARLSNLPPSPIPEHLVARIALTRGEILMRLNRYSESIIELETAHRIYSAIDDLEGQLASEKIRNTILRDLGRYDDAVALANSIVERAEQRLTPSTLVAGSFQALARSLAFRSEMVAGVEAATRGLQISLSIHSIRGEGNSYLALGEVYRHHMELSEAILNYEKAIRIAERIANRDSLLWSLLGLADALLLKDEISSAKQALNQVGEIVRNAAEHYPLEYLHWQLSMATIDYLSGGSTADELKASALKYESLGITWPADYVHSLIRAGKATIAKDM